MVSAAEKYASEIEIFTFSRGFQTQISRGNVQKRCFHQSVFERFGQTDFFNTTGQKRTLTKGCYVPLFADHCERNLDAAALHN